MLSLDYFLLPSFSLLVSTNFSLHSNIAHKSKITLLQHSLKADYFLVAISIHLQILSVCKIAENPKNTKCWIWIVFIKKYNLFYKKWILLEQHSSKILLKLPIFFSLYFASVAGSYWGPATEAKRWAFSLLHSSFILVLVLSIVK